MILRFATDYFSDHAHALNNNSAFRNSHAAGFTKRRSFSTLCILISRINVLRNLRTSSITFSLNRLKNTRFDAVRNLRKGRTRLQRTAIRELLAALRTQDSLTAKTKNRAFIAATADLTRATASTATQAILFTANAQHKARVIRLRKLALRARRMMNLISRTTILEDILGFSNVVSTARTRALSTDLIINRATIRTLSRDSFSDYRN